MDLYVRRDIHKAALVIDELGTTYCGDRLGNLYAINEDGKLLWKYRAMNGLSTPAIGKDGTLYIATHGLYKSKGHQLIAISSNGEFLWDFLIDDASNDSPPIICNNGDLLVVTHGGRLLLLSSDGHLKWEIIKKPTILLPTIGMNNVIYFITTTGYLYAIDLDGNEKWNIYIGIPRQFNDPMIDAEGNIYISSYNVNEKKGVMYVISQEGSILWRYTLDDHDIWTAPTVGENQFLYLGTSLHKLIAVNQNRMIEWGIPFEGSIFSPLVIAADGALLFNTYREEKDGYVTRIYAVTRLGTIKWVYHLNGSFTIPAISRGRTIYFVGNDIQNDRGVIHAINCKNI